MGFLKLWALIVIGLVILGWIRGKHFLAFSTAGFVGLGGLMVLDRASEAGQPSNSILSAVLFLAVVLSTLSLIANHVNHS
tara:strand:+ start:153 stop:392 length:240 start_codon:yes stop_codon:yes gene_type:complete